MAVKATIQSTKGPARWEWYITKIVAQLRVLARADQAHHPLCFSLSFCPPISKVDNTIHPEYDE